MICSLAFIVFCFFQEALAQNDQTLKPVTGAVKDAKGEPIQGVNVVLKGTGDGTVTDQKGNFQINAPRTGVLVFSFIGYTEKEITVGNLSNLNVQLDPDDKTLSDVVVVGYGTQKKVNVIGSVVSRWAKRTHRSSCVQHLKCTGRAASRRHRLPVGR